MSGRRRKGKRATRDMFDKANRGTEMTITVGAGLLHIIDAVRDDVEERSGVITTRRQVLEGLLRKVWFGKLVEASAHSTGGEVSEGIEDLGKRGGK